MCLPDGSGQVELPEFSQACTGHSTGKHIYAPRDGRSEGGRLRRHAATTKSNSVIDFEHQQLVLYGNAKAAHPGVAMGGAGSSIPFGESCQTGVCDIIAVRCTRLRSWRWANTG